VRYLLGLLAVLLLGGCVAPGTEPAGRRWIPRAGLTWQIQLTGAFDPTADAGVYDLDPYTTGAQIVGDLDAHGRQTICHLDIGVADTSTPDGARLRGPVRGTSAGPGRYWLDIRQWTVIEPVLTDRFTLCKDKGFQAVDADSGYGYTEPTGFGLTADDQVLYDQRVAGLARGLGLAVAVRTPPDIAALVEPHVDFSVVGGCFSGSDCGRYAVYIDADKAVFDVETGARMVFCGLTRSYGIVAIRKRSTLDAFVQYC
jgi:hypothetical protein